MFGTSDEILALVVDILLECILPLCKSEIAGNPGMAFFYQTPSSSGRLPFAVPQHSDNNVCSFCYASRSSPSVKLIKRASKRRFLIKQT